jgi:hypothetical protein
MRLRSLPTAPLLAATLLLACLGPAATVRAGDDPLSEYELRRKEGHCLCNRGFASWQYLRSPLRPPADPPVCGLLRAGGDCSSRPRPKGTSADCWGSQKVECFWKRHAYSYGIHCSECWKDSDCTLCDKLIGKPDPQIKATLEHQLALESAGRRHVKMVVAYTKHFYLVTDIDHKLKVRTLHGPPRVATAHEVAHLYLERCERAYADFDHWFGGDLHQDRPMAVYLMRRKQTADAYAQKYFGNAKSDMLYGGGAKHIGGGFAYNGFVASLGEQRTDDALHAYCRHMIGHILFSVWKKVDGTEKYCPKWAFVGAAHFLEKLLEPHKDMANFCADESTAPTGSGKDWDKKARGLAGHHLDPIETFFAYGSLSKFSYRDHIRAWSLMDLCLREDHDRWLAVLASLRYGNEEGVALSEGMGLTPDQFNSRWVDRLTGKRKTMGVTRKDTHTDPDEPGRLEREQIRTTQDADVLAGRIRGVHEVDDVRLVKAIVGRLDHESDLVREAIEIVLSRVRDEKVLTWLREQGLQDRNGMVRAGVARALGELKYAAARADLEAMLQKDTFWLARANAAEALARIGDARSLKVLVPALAEKQDKAWMAIADATASFHHKSKEATLLTVSRVDASAWQLRVTACRALAAYGTAECMDALIKRFAKERGRLERELRAALKAVSGDDLGPKASTWETWWEQQQKLYGGFDPHPPPKPASDEGRYAKPSPPNPDDPHYYGRRIYSHSVGFVFDTSASMDTEIHIPQGASTRLGDIPTRGTRLVIAKQVLAGAIRKLKPKVRFKLVFFSSEVRPWRKGLVPASPGNTAAAAGAIMAVPADGETNIHGALKAVLGLTDQPTLGARLQDMPDTVYFLTDGSPTRGEITSTPELLGWFRNLNRFAKVRLNVVAFGNVGVDLGFLRRLAEAGDGEFIHVPER